MYRKIQCPQKTNRDKFEGHGSDIIFCTEALVGCVSVDLSEFYILMHGCSCATDMGFDFLQNYIIHQPISKYYKFIGMASNIGTSIVRMCHGIGDIPFVTQSFVSRKWWDLYKYIKTHEIKLDIKYMSYYDGNSILMMDKSIDQLTSDKVDHYTFTRIWR